MIQLFCAILVQFICAILVLFSIHVIEKEAEEKKRDTAILCYISTVYMCYFSVVFYPG